MLQIYGMTRAPLAVGVLGIARAVLAIGVGLLTATASLRACYLADTLTFAAAIYGMARLPAMPPQTGPRGPGYAQSRKVCGASGVRRRWQARCSPA